MNVIPLKGKVGDSFTGKKEEERILFKFIKEYPILKGFHREDIFVKDTRISKGHSNKLCVRGIKWALSVRGIKMCEGH